MITSDRLSGDACRVRMSVLYNVNELDVTRSDISGAIGSCLGMSDR